MNLEQRELQFEKINKLEGLLAYAVAHGEMEEAERIRRDLVELVDGLQ